ncbi:methionine--tRNA ligase [Candidatus Woesearchaeota archaeon]|nr:MAG: methionine--tRNA ligase [Candidatus Woesearchaeota archaeon]
MPKKTYYVTTAIAYPNAAPHIGFAYELIIADFLARWHELAGFDVFYLTGTDEHGQKLEQAAKSAGKKPRQFIDEMVGLFVLLCEKLGVRNDAFIRTTDKKHVKTAQEIWRKVADKGLIYKGTYTGLYCTGCEAFYLERELENGLCPTHKKAVQEISEESYFFKLSAFQEDLVRHIEGNPEFIQPESKRKEILQRLKEPLRDLSVSRASFKWGIPVPGDPKHVMYVWFDALINYLSGISYPTRKFEKFWPADCQVIGKDILWFHSVIWPAILMASDLPLPKTILVHGHLTKDGHKMSKSLGNVVDPFDVVERFGSDALRYVLLRDVPAGRDGDFSEKALVARNNGDLADSLGNLLQRVSKLVHKNFDGKIPPCSDLTSAEKELEKEIPDLKELSFLVDSCEWNRVIELIWNYIKACNKYVNDQAPWKVEDKARLSTILYTALEHLRIISILVYPIIPKSARKLSECIGVPLGKFRDAKFKTGLKGFISQPRILFEKFDEPEPAESSDPLSRIDLRVGVIEKVEDHPKADRLYVLTIDAGDHKRTLVAGVKKFYSKDELLGKRIVFVSNLKPARLRGVESQGMMLAAEKGDSVKVVEAPGARAGEQVFVPGIVPKSDTITIDDFMAVKLEVKGGRVLYNGKALRTEQGDVMVDIEDGAKVR